MQGLVLFPLYTPCYESLGVIIFPACSYFYVHSYHETQVELLEWQDNRSGPSIIFRSGHTASYQPLDPDGDETVQFRNSLHTGRSASKHQLTQSGPRGEEDVPLVTPEMDERKSAKIAYGALKEDISL